MTKDITKAEKELRRLDKERTQGRWMLDVGISGATIIAFEEGKRVVTSDTKPFEGRAARFAIHLANHALDTIDAKNADLKELAQDVMEYADVEWEFRDKYPAQQVKWERDTETARRVLEALNNE